MARPDKQAQTQKLLDKKAEKERLKSQKASSTPEPEETITGDSNEYGGMGYSNEPEIKNKKVSDEPVTSTVDPFLSAKTTEKPYAKDNATIIGNIPNSVPEEIIEAPIINVSAGAGTNEKKFEPGEVRNPHWDEMPKKEQTMGSEFIAENVLSMYEGLNEIAKNYASFDEQKYMQKALKGEFDMDVLDLELPITEDASQTIHVRQVLQDTNESAENAFTVSEKFKEQARPLLTYIFNKKGWGLSPEHQLIYLFGKDAVPKIMALVEIRKTQKEFLNIATQVLSQYKELNKKQSQAAKTIAQAQAASASQNNVAETPIVTMKVEKTVETKEEANSQDFPVSEESPTILIQDNTTELTSERDAALGQIKKNGKKGKKNITDKDNQITQSGLEPGEE